MYSLYSQHRLIWTLHTREIFIRITRWCEFSGVQVLLKLIIYLNFVSREVFEYGELFTLSVCTLSDVHCAMIQTFPDKKILPENYYLDLL